jgi:hypothetical protein
MRAEGRTAQAIATIWAVPRTPCPAGTSAPAGATRPSRDNDAGTERVSSGAEALGRRSPCGADLRPNTGGRGLAVCPVDPASGLGVDRSGDEGGLPIRPVGVFLEWWGLTPQQPLEQAYAQDPVAVPRWLQEEYPARTAAFAKPRPGWRIRLAEIHRYSGST